MRREMMYSFLILLHNVLFTLLIVMGSFSHSSTVSITALTYWIIGWIIIFRNRKEIEL
jgi:hypothetical protein